MLRKLQPFACTPDAKPLQPPVVGRRGGEFVPVNFWDITAHMPGNPTWQSWGAENGIMIIQGLVSPECGVILAPKARLFREVVMETS